MLTLQQLLDKEDVSQRELARLLETNSQNVCRWCKGSRKIPAKIALAISDRYGYRVILAADGTFIFSRKRKQIPSAAVSASA